MDNTGDPTQRGNAEPIDEADGQVALIPGVQDYLLLPDPVLPGYISSSTTPETTRYPAWYEMIGTEDTGYVRIG